ncbi:flagellar brake protein [Cohnella sp. AR92]|uniref:flagellar brake protein n=1 Tax=Cohnella sp. AR92 TaxID=648716 RepID=UPI000F8E9413|nr:flagellar brake domain-containing protein [Cohnella sp. AR92]RUS48149.1 glycosyl transferase [Cohnella sp. AR92]
MLPKVNQTMFLQLDSEVGQEQAPTYRSRIADQNAESIFIEIPMDEQTKRYYRTQTGEKLIAYYYTADGVKHQFSTVVKGHVKDAVTLVEIRMPLPEEISKEQRRSFLRVETQLELAVRIGEKVRFVALTEDVGGGGVSFRCERKWPVTRGMKLNCWLLVPYRTNNVTHAQFVGEVVRVAEAEPKHYIVMMKFNEIQDAEQQKIIRYCFERQLDMRRD